MTTSPGDRAGRRWWSAAPDPDLPAIGARRAYTEVLLVYLAFFAAAIVSAALLLANRYTDVFKAASWSLYMTEALDIICQAGLAVAVVLLLAARRQVTPASLGLVPARLPDGRLAVSRTIRVAAWCFFAIIVGAVINSVLQTGELPSRHVSAAELIASMAESIQAGVIEEMVVLAFVVVTLRQARRPWWEVTAAVLVLRGAYHIYYGPGVLGILVWAALFYWIYLRTRQLLPLIVCHAVWDAVAFGSRATIAVAGVGEVLVVVLWITAIILWLVERNNRQPQMATGYGYGNGHGYAKPAWPPTTGPLPPVPPRGPTEVGAGPNPPPGWHPDPAGHNRWRWWDGYRWTDYVSPHS